MSLLILVLQSTRYAILTIALRLFLFANFLEKNCVCVIHQSDRIDTSASQTISCCPTPEQQDDKQATLPRTPKRQPGELHGDTSSNTSRASPLNSDDNSDLASDSSTCTSISSCTSSPEYITNSIVPLIQHVASDMKVVNNTASGECGRSLVTSEQIRKSFPRSSHSVNGSINAIHAFSFVVPNAHPALPLSGTLVKPFVSCVGKDGLYSSQSNAWQSITFMEAYSKFSFEELRFSDYAIAARLKCDITDWPRILLGLADWSPACMGLHHETASIISEMCGIQRMLVAWRDGSEKIKPSLGSGLGLHLLMTFTAPPSRFEHHYPVITVLDRSRNQYVRVAEALTWRGGAAATGLTVTMSDEVHPSPTPLCCMQQIMPSIYQRSAFVTIYVWDTKLKTFVDLEDMLTTRALRRQANIRIEKRDVNDRWMRPGYKIGRDSTWEEFAARANFDGLIFERLVGEGKHAVLAENLDRLRTRGDPIEYDGPH